MTPQKLWVLKAHMKIDKIDGNFRNLRQYFDIYPNIDNQKNKEMKKETNTNEQATKQINKRTNKETN